MKKNLLLMLSLMATASALVCGEETDPMAPAAERPEALTYDYDSQAEPYMEEGLLTGDNPEILSPNGDAEEELDGGPETYPETVEPGEVDADE